MAPLAARNDANDRTVGGMPHSVMAAIIVAILLGGAAFAAFVLFGTRTYRAVIAWWRARQASASTPSPASMATPAAPPRGGVARPTASLPRFAQNLGAAMHLPRPNTSSAATRPVSSLRAYPTGMGRAHTRRGSEASTNSTAGLLRVPAPSSPQPVFVRGGTATGQGMTR